MERILERYERSSFAEGQLGPIDLETQVYYSVLPWNVIDVINHTHEWHGLVQDAFLDNIINIEQKMEENKNELQI